MFSLVNRESLLKMGFTVCVISFLVVAQSSLLFAQNEELKEDQVPEAVVKAIETDFPYWQSIKWYAFDEVTNDWAMVTRDGNAQKFMADHYVVTAKGKNVTTHAVYYKNGKLLRSRTQIKDAALPSAVLQTIGKEYPGWKVVGDLVVIKNFDENKKYFKVELENGGQKQTAYFDHLGQKTTRRKFS